MVEIANRKSAVLEREKTTSQLGQKCESLLKRIPDEYSVRDYPQILADYIKRDVSQRP